MAEKSFWQTFKDWATTGTSEAEAMEAKVLFNVVKKIITKSKRVPKKSKDLFLRELGNLKKVEKNIPSQFFTPVKKVKFSPHKFSGFTVSGKKKGLMELHFDADDVHTLDELIIHEATHGLQYNPPFKKIPKAVKDLSKTLHQGQRFFATVEKTTKIPNIYHLTAPDEQHAILLERAYSHGKLFKKQDPSFFPKFYKKLENKIFSSPERLRAIKDEQVNILADYYEEAVRKTLKKRPLKEWQELFRGID